MTLGDIFEKLGKISVSNIMRWYANGSMIMLLAFGITLFGFVAFSMLWAIFSALPWYVTVAFFAIAPGLALFFFMDFKNNFID